MGRRSSARLAGQPVEFSQVSLNSSKKMDLETYERRRDATTETELQKLTSSNDFKDWKAKRAKRSWYEKVDWQKKIKWPTLACILILIISGGLFTFSQLNIQKSSIASISQPATDQLIEESGTEMGEYAIYDNVQADDKMNKLPEQINKSNSGGTGLPEESGGIPTEGSLEIESELEVMRTEVAKLLRLKSELEQQKLDLQSKITPNTSATDLVQQSNAFRNITETSTSEQNSRQDKSTNDTEQSRPFQTFMTMGPGVVALLTISVGLYGSVSKDKKIQKANEIAQESKRILKLRVQQQEEREAQWRDKEALAESQVQRQRQDLAGFQNVNDQLVNRIELLTQDISRAEVRNTQLKNDLVKNNQLIKIREAKLVQAEGDAKQKCLEMEKKIEEYKQKMDEAGKRIQALDSQVQDVQDKTHRKVLAVMEHMTGMRSHFSQKLQASKEECKKLQKTVDMMKEVEMKC